MILDKLKLTYSNCNKCEKLYLSRSQVVFGSGSQSAKVILIGEAPGATEDKQGIPFCGMSGKILNELLSSANLSREDIFITNTILCRPEKNRNPTKEEVSNCRSRLDNLIELIQPKVIVTIGNFATKRILGRTGIKTIHGKIFQITINNKEIKVIPVIHPASFLYSGRSPELLNLMKTDFKTISSIVKN